ncbi:TPA: hypothetical protein ACXDAZ_002634 [Clostridium botulinum]
MMKVIRGRNGKALKINEIIKNKTYNKVLIVGLFSNCFHEINCDYLEIKNSEEMFTEFLNEESLNKFISNIKNNNYDLLVFYTNDNESNLDCYGVFDDKLDIDVIVSIQDSNEGLEIFEV